MGLSDSWPYRILRYAYYALFGLIPFLFTPWNYELFEFNKMLGTYAIAAIIAGVWLYKTISTGKLEIRRTPLDIPILLFVVSQVVSSIYSVDRHISWFGYYSRQNGGLLSIFTYVFLYYAFVSMFRNENTHEISPQFPNPTTKSIPKSKFPTSADPTVRQRTNAAYGVYHFVRRLLAVSLASAALISFYAVLERFGIDAHVWVQDVRSRVFSTLGQPNWLAAYIVAVTPMSWAILLRLPSSTSRSHSSSQIPNPNRAGMATTPSNSTWPRKAGIGNFLSLLFFVVLLFTGSRSGYAGFAVAFAAFWSMVVRRTGIRSQTTTAFTILTLILFVTMAVIGTRVERIDRFLTIRGLISPTATTPAPEAPSPAPLAQGITESGELRKYVWEGALNAWKSSTKTMAIGTGTETFSYAFFRYKPVGHNLTSEWDFLYNKAHNEYLNYLTTTGVFGFGSYLVFVVAFIVWFVKYHMANFTIQTNSKFQQGNDMGSELGDSDSGFWVLKLALFSGWLSILVTNFFGFSVVVVQVFLFLFPAIIISLTNDELRMRRIRVPGSSWPAWVHIGLASMAGVVLLGWVSNYWRADSIFAAGYRAVQFGDVSGAVPSLRTAVRMRTGEPLYQNELAGALSDLALATSDTDATAASELLAESIAYSTIATTLSPNTVAYWKTRTKIFYSFATVDQGFLDEAFIAIRRAITLSPLDPKLTYNLALLYGLNNDQEQALTHLREAIRLKPNYRDAYYALYIYLTDLGRTDEAGETLRTYLDRVDPNDQEFRDFLAE